MSILDSSYLLFLKICILSTTSVFILDENKHGIREVIDMVIRIYTILMLFMNVTCLILDTLNPPVH